MQKILLSTTAMIATTAFLAANAVSAPQGFTFAVEQQGCEDSITGINALIEKTAMTPKCDICATTAALLIARDTVDQMASGEIETSNFTMVMEFDGENTVAVLTMNTGAVYQVTLDADLLNDAEIYLARLTVDVPVYDDSDVLLATNRITRHRSAGVGAKQTAEARTFARGMAGVLDRFDVAKAGMGPFPLAA